MRVLPATTSRRVRSRGNAMVEASLVLVTFMALVLAICDFGMAIWAKATLQHAVREGVRYAITFQTNPTLGNKHDASILSIVKTNSMGLLSTTAKQATVHIRYFDPSNPSTEIATNSPGSIVQVSVENYTWNWMVPLWRSTTPLSISVYSADRMESLPGSLTSPPARS
jgi:Flp pilus assembly protein TadG